MEDLLGKVSPILETIREWILKGATWISGAFDLNVENVYLVLIIVISLWLARRILTFFYSSLEGRMGYWIILAAGIFWVLKFLT